MSLRSPSLLLALCAVVIPLIIAAPATAQSTDGRWVMPRTADGHPDLQGSWTNETLTPMSRPDGQDQALALDVAAQGEKRRADIAAFLARPSDPDREAPPVGGDGSTAGGSGGVGGYNYFYIDSGDNYALFNGEIRTSLIVDPPSGRYPERTEASRERRAERTRAIRAAGGRGGQYDNPENRPLAERCLKSFGSNMGPPMLPNYFYNNNYTIVQTADYVMIMTEMVHDTRIIRIGDGPKLPPHIRPWMGDSWGHWEGDVLVVETTNFTNKTGSFNTSFVSWGSAEHLTLVERFTRVDADTVMYEWTVNDPDTWTQAFTGQFPMLRADEPLYEYACHEGNYGMQNLLSGARAAERTDTTQP